MGREGRDAARVCLPLPLFFHAHVDQQAAPLPDLSVNAPRGHGHTFRVAGDGGDRGGMDQLLLPLASVHENEVVLACGDRLSREIKHPDIEQGGRVRL